MMTIFVTLLQDKLAEVEQFQSEAREEVSTLNQILSSDSQPHSTAKLKELIERGGSFEFHVPELETLKLALQQNKWVTETKERLRLEMQSVEGLKNLVKQGNNLIRGSPGIL